MLDSPTLSLPIFPLSNGKRNDILCSKKFTIYCVFPNVCESMQNNNSFKVKMRLNIIS